MEGGEGVNGGQVVMYIFDYVVQCNLALSPAQKFLNLPIKSTTPVVAGMVVALKKPELDLPQNDDSLTT